MSAASPSTVARACTLALALTLVGARPGADLRKGPVYLLIEGPDLEAPLVLSGPELQELHRAMVGSEVIEGAVEEGERVYRVGEFWMGWERTPPPLEDGSPSAPLTMDMASAISTIRADAPNGPTWNPYAFGPVLMRSAPVSPAELRDWVNLGIEPEPLPPLRNPPEPIPSRAEFRRMPAEVVAALRALGLDLGGRAQGSAPPPTGR